MAWGDGWSKGIVTEPSGPCWGIYNKSGFVDDQGWDDCTGCYLTFSPTHWMNLPAEPPQDSKE